jgi:hypothetical protein
MITTMTAHGWNGGTQYIFLFNFALYFCFSHLFVSILKELEYCKRVVLSVRDDAGVRIIITELLSASSQKEPKLCWAAITMLHQFCDNTEVDYSDYRIQLFRGLIGLFIRHDDKILLASWDCLSAVTKVMFSLSVSGSFYASLLKPDM